MVTRREFLSTALLLPAAFRQTAGGRFVATLPLGNPTGRPTAPLERLLGSGLNARLFTNLAGGGAGVIPNEKFFIRTAAPRALPNPAGWAIEVGGLVERPERITTQALESLPPSSGRYVLECSGNSDPSNYGLLSSADWEGVPLTALLDRVKPSSNASRVLVSGVDDPDDPAGSSTPGASWIFTRDQLARALVATRMNGAPLPRDHGSPVRLIVPGWYGCACIKWMNRIDLVADDAPATSQMKEFSSRTHQGGVHALASEYAPALIDTAAMPVRVEKWVDASGRPFYRIAGIMWGGSKPTNALSIRFRSNLPWTKVEECPMPSTTDTWSPWTHTWRPDSRGRYTIVLRVEDPAIRTRRLDLFFYARDLQIEQV